MFTKRGDHRVLKASNVFVALYKQVIRLGTGDMGK